jgi:hypothetical protein
MSSAADEKGTYNGTATNVNFNVAGKFGNAGNFSGGASYVNLNSAVLPASVFSVSLWINLDSLSTAWLFSQYTGGATGRFIFNVTPTGGFQINVTSTNSLATTNIPVITTGNWHHVVIVKDGSNGWTLYADGTPHSTWNSTENILTNQNTVLGGDDSVTGSNMVGTLDQVRIFNSALNATQVTSLYNEVACPCTTNNTAYPTTNLAYYKLDGDADDSSGNNFFGSPSNVTYPAGKFNQAASFNGSSSYISTGINIDSYGVSSYSFWVYWDNNVSNCVIGGTGNDGSTGRKSNRQSIFLTKSSNRFDYISRQGVFCRHITSLSDGWHHFAVTDDNGTSVAAVDMYIDGQPVSFTSPTFGDYSTNTALQIGRTRINTGAINSYFDGLIDQVRIFSSVLSATEITDLYDEQYCFDNFFNDDSTAATYKLNNTALDDLGRYNGTPSNITYGAGKFDEAAVFNGSSSGISIPNSAGNNISTFSISFWFKTNGQAATGTLFNNGGADSTQTGWYISILSSGVLRFVTSQGGNQPNSDGTTNYADNSWHNVVLVYTAVGVGTSTYNVYVDGNSTPEITGSNGRFTTTATQPLTIGRFARVALGYFDGSIDQVRIFNRALSSGEVTALYNE